MHQKNSPLLLALMLAITITIVFSLQNDVQIPYSTAVTTSAGIGVYWDSHSTNSCRSISWGQLFPGARKTMELFIRNEGNDSVYYLLATEQWYPVNASSYMSLQWDYNGTRATSGSFRRVSLTLVVSPRIRGIADFSFDIVITGSPYPLGDVNHDFKVDGRDLALIAQAFGSIPGWSTWNSLADLNQDGKIDGIDVAIVARNFGKIL